MVLGFGAIKLRPKLHVYNSGVEDKVDGVPKSILARSIYWLFGLDIALFSKNDNFLYVYFLRFLYPCCRN